MLNIDLLNHNLNHCFESYFLSVYLVAIEVFFLLLLNHIFVSVNLAAQEVFLLFLLNHIFVKYLLLPVCFRLMVLSGSAVSLVVESSSCCY